MSSDEHGLESESEEGGEEFRYDEHLEENCVEDHITRFHQQTGASSNIGVGEFKSAVNFVHGEEEISEDNSGNKSVVEDKCDASSRAYFEYKVGEVSERNFSSLEGREAAQDFLEKNEFTTDQTESSWCGDAGRFYYDEDDTSPVSKSRFAEAELAAAFEIAEMKKELKKKYQQEKFIFGTFLLLFVLSVLSALTTLYLNNGIPKTFSTTKEDEKLTHLKREREFWKSRYEEEKAEATDIINHLEFQIEQEYMKHADLRNKIDEIRSRIEHEEQHRDPVPKGMKGDLEREEEALITEIVIMREKMKLLEEDSYKRDSLLSEILAAKKNMAQQEKELQNTLLSAQQKLDVKCSQLRSEMDRKLSKLLFELKELSQLQIPHIVRQRYQEVLLKKLLLERVSKAAVDLLEDNVKLQEREKDLHVELEETRELAQLLSAEAEKRRKKLLRKLNERKGRILEEQKELELLKSGTHVHVNRVSNIRDSVLTQQSQAEDMTSVSASTDDNFVFVRNSSVSNKLSETNELQLYKLGSLGLIYPNRKPKGERRRVKSSSYPSSFMEHEKERKLTTIEDLTSKKILSELGLMGKFSNSRVAKLEQASTTFGGRTYLE